MKKYFIIFFVILVILSLVWTLRFLYKKSESKPVVYEHIKPLVTDVIRKVVLAGTVIPRKEVLIKSQVSGIIDKIFVTPGTFVKSGDVIARIKIIPDMVSMNEAENRLKRSVINKEQMQQEFDRAEKLFHQGAIPQSEFLIAQTNAKNAMQEVEASEGNLQIIREGVNSKLGNATNTIVRSTISGMLLDIPVKEGNSVIQSNTFNEGTTIASIADMGKMIFEGKIDESEIGRLSPGMPMLMTVGAIGNNKIFNATLEYIAPKGTVENGTVQFLVRAAINIDRNYFLRANYSANADIVIEKKNNVLTLPESVLRFSGDSVFVEKKDKSGNYQRTPVKTGISDGINIEILSGLFKDDLIKGNEIPEGVENE